jgi:DNA-binding transcriptional LysR family regulator
MDHLACMATFVAVVEKGGFAAAARCLSIAPATVTLQIQTLEHRIGARLLQRTTRKSTLTEAGHVFYERVVKILEDVGEADAIANAFHATSRGTIRLQTSPTLSQEVSALVARYVAAHPETSFHLNTTSRMGNLLDDQIDLAIRDEAVAESSLIVRRLARAEWTACASPDHVARHGLPIHPAELAEHNCLVYIRDRDCDQWRFTDRNGSRSIRVSGSLRSSDPHALRMAALSDQGLILLPDAMVSEDMQTGRLVRVLNGYSAEPATIRAVYPSRRQLSLKVRTFLDFVAVAFGGSPQIEFRARFGSSAARSVSALSGRQQNSKQMAELGGEGELRYSPAWVRSVMASPAGPSTPKCSGTALSANRRPNGQSKL